MMRITSQCEIIHYRLSCINNVQEHEREYQSIHNYEYECMNAYVLDSEWS